MNGIRLAISWLTVLPVRGPDDVDRAAGRAILVAPLVGALLGAGAAGLLLALTRAGASAALAGLLVVGALALATRGMHLDGLADTMDGLGSYGPPERARQIMKSGGAGPFGVAGIMFAVGVQAFSFAALAGAGRWFAVALAVATGRVAVVLACRGIAAAPGTGFGVLVAGTQSRLAAVSWSAAAVAISVLAVPDRPWLGPLAVVVALAASSVLVVHCARRFGGLSGDVLGAALESSVAVAAAVLSLAI
ncbi:adenosylcobinamide-GDP ribazoletransferase [Nocardia sp. NBC_00508]|uniref:adenosylcobinamide-GDP ribazoletransferase n=1 Tax=Nocardia sp. NBC_00508 TaxID=2975992 RepID=UPI002E822FDA|nr:adenosylcobinamide-GDP ribazoletransferase [Nocardia sp. NBC_00508]WUD67677.1 adenosylcobinamide-GDP ribazoletransferase [Nocardia sp. NBC_00508]